jgi:enoyl-CoA hydratase/carnithine racemase
MALLTHHFVGRAEALGSFDEVLTEVDKVGGTAAIELIGEPGIGKTRFLRVHPDHDRAEDALGVAPGVDQRRARSGALAQEVDALVTQRDARALQVVDPLRQAVAGEIVAVLRQSIRAGPETIGERAERLLAEEIGRVLERRLRLRAVEHRGTVHAAVADKDDVVVVGEPARLRNVSS